MKQAATRKSRQRELILQLLRHSTVHPTADWIYEKLKKEFPSLSLGTVYRNLTILIDQGLVKKIHSGSTYDRFEANISPHYHLICRACGKIMDFEMQDYNTINEKARQLTRFQIDHHKIDFFGLCENCQSNQNK
jgi:Fur family transcriptional regulator, peroxide stress response regulator